MLAKLLARLDAAERKLRYSFGEDIVTPRGRRLSKLHYNLFDHAFLRTFWTNFWPVAPGVWRSNQPTHKRFVTYKAMGIKTVINLRGTDRRAHYLFEEESCRDLGLTLVNTRLHARHAVARENFLEVIDALRAAERPMMFHCKSGADRAGMVAAMYQMIFDDQPVEVARKQLGLKFIHLKFTKTGVQDYILDVYAARNTRAPIGFEDWMRSEYNGPAIQAGFDAKTPADQLVLPA